MHLEAYYEQIISLDVVPNLQLLPLQPPKYPQLAEVRSDKEGCTKFDDHTVLLFQHKKMALFPY